MDKNYTDVYPTRYHAFDNPGAWAIFRPIDGLYRSCRLDATPGSVETLGACQAYPGEAAVLSIPSQNERYPHLTDGFHVEILGRLDGSEFIARCHHTQPNADRGQTNKTIRHAGSLEGAIDAAEAWIAEVSA